MTLRLPDDVLDRVKDQRPKRYRYWYSARHARYLMDSHERMASVKGGGFSTVLLEDGSRAPFTNAICVSAPDPVMAKYTRPWREVEQEYQLRWGDAVYVRECFENEARFLQYPYSEKYVDWQPGTDVTGG